MPGAWQLLMVALPASQTSFEKLSFSNPFSQYANGGIPGWQYGGATTLAEDYVRLTPAAVDTVGYMWSEQTVDATSDWELQLEFHIGGPAERGAGGGLALWLTSNKRAPMDGALYGHGDEFDGLGVFFDTHEAGEGDPANDKQPFVVAMVNHGSKAARVSNQLGVCFAAYRNRKHPVTVRVTHVRGVLTIALDVVDDGRFATPCIATVAGDARVVLARNSYVGLSASTGLYPDSHVVYALTLSATPPAGTGGGAAPDDSDGGSGAGADVDAAQPDLSTRHHHHEPHHPPATADARARPPPSPSATHADTHADGETSEKGERQHAPPSATHADAHADGETSEKGERQHALSGVASVFGAHAGGHAQSLRPADAAKAHVPTAAHGGASAAASAHAPLSGADAGLSADVHSTQAWVHAIERALAAEHELNARRHAEAMDAIRAIGQRAGADAAGPLTNGAHDGRGRAPPLLGGGAGPELSRSVERILALVEGLAAASGTGGAPGADAAAQIASTLDERLAAISAALSQTVDAAKHGAGAEQTRQSLDSMQRLVEASVDKLHAMQAQQERAESAHTSLLSSLKGHLSELGSSHTELHGAVSKSLGAAAGSGGGAWMSLGSFVVFQALFTAVFLFYKRYVDSNKDKLF